MLDRVKFWWRSLSLGADRLYGAAGWLALVVLILGVAAGIAVPLVFKLTSWLTAVVLMGFFIVVLLEGTYRVWHATERQREESSKEIERRFDSMRYALQISDINPSFIMNPSSMDVQIALKIKNNSDEYMRYETESYSLLIEGRRSPEGPLHGSAAAIIPPHGIDTFTPPPSPTVPLHWQMGSISWMVRYGHASSEQLQYRMRWEAFVQAMRQPGLPQGTLSGVHVVPANIPDIEKL